MKSQQKIYIFLYSPLLKIFGSNLVLAKDNIELFQSEARLHIHKDLQVFVVKLIPNQVHYFNMSLQTPNSIHENLFNSLTTLPINYEP